METKLSSAADKTEGWDAIQKNLDKLEKWAHESFLSSSRSARWPNWAGAIPAKSTDWGKISLGAALVEEDSEVLVDARLDTTW